MGGSRAGVRARRGQEPRPDWGAPVFMGVVGAGVRRLLREEGASAIVRKRQEAGGGGALVTVWKKWRGWDTDSFCVCGGGGKESIDIFRGRNKTGHCIKGTVQHNL